MNVTVMDADCPVGTIYRVSADYYRDHYEHRLEKIPDAATMVMLVHPATAKMRDIPVVDSSWS